MYAAFLERGLQLSKREGLSALLTMRNWMFIKQHAEVRKHLNKEYNLLLIGDLETGAFEEVSAAQVILSVAMTIFQKTKAGQSKSVALQPAPGDLKTEDNTNRKRAALICQAGRFEFNVNQFKDIREMPLVYWWSKDFLRQYLGATKLGDESEVKKGMDTGDVSRFTRFVWEVNIGSVLIRRIDQPVSLEADISWVPCVKGAAGRCWYENLVHIVKWERGGLEEKVFATVSTGAVIRSANYFFRPGIAFSTIGAKFRARKHRYRSIADSAGSSVFPLDLSNTTCLMNSTRSGTVITALNPTVNFKNIDVERLPLFPIESADEIFTQLEAAFTTHESAREPSVEFIHPAPTCWPYAQAWAQQAVDRPAGKPLPPWEPEYEQPLATHWISYAIGLSLGRFPLASSSASISSEAEGRTAITPLPHGIMYLSAYSAGQPDAPDSLSHPACDPLTASWTTHSSQLTKKPLHDWLRLNFFKDVHLAMYEQRPIYFPLSSASKNFVALISIHRWDNNTLKDLLAEYLTQDLIPLEGELNDLADSKNQGDAKTQTQTENRYTHLQTLHQELTDFIALVRQCAETGPPPANPKDPHPEAPKVSYQMDLDDGVMINSAALWPLLEPQWKKPKTWWHELCTAKGKKDYDWSHLAARYFPSRVDAKCQQDPSLAVAHGCFWQYHPAKATEWELRLQDEIGPDFTIDEANSDALRQQFETEQPEIVQALKEKEEKRRERKYKKQEKDQLALDM